MEYGDVPQNRERIYIVGFRKETELIIKFEFPKKIPLTKSILDILENNVDEKDIDEMRAILSGIPAESAESFEGFMHFLSYFIGFFIK